MVVMKRKAVIVIFVVVILIVASLAVILWNNLSKTEEATNKLYSYSISVDNKIYFVTVETNWTSAPKIDLPEVETKYFNCDFIGSTRATVGFNITFPKELIGGNISLVWKYYEQNPDRYFLSNNSTHNSIQMTFNHIATVEHFEIRGTEGALANVI